MKAVADLKREEIPCLYTGSLDHDAEDSAVTVDGCQGDPQVVFVDVDDEKTRAKRKGSRWLRIMMLFMIMIMGNGLLLRLLPSGDCRDCELEGGWRSPYPCYSRWTDLSINRGSYCIYYDLVNPGGQTFQLQPEMTDLK